MSNVQFQLKSIYSSFCAAIFVTLCLSGCGGETPGDVAVASSVVDDIAPIVSATSPVNGTTDVGVNSAVSATFSEPMSNATLNNATFTLQPTAGGAPVTGTVSVTGNVATLTASSSLTPTTQYTATILAAATDAAGNPLSFDHSWQFTTGATTDTTPPTVSATSPIHHTTGVTLNSSVSATFSEAMTNATLNTTSFTLRPVRGSPITGTVNVSGNTVTFTPSSSLVGNTQYQAQISSAATDAAGNAMAANYSWQFTTGAAPDTTPPTVSSIVPARNANGVMLNASISATFSEAMTNATLTASTFVLRRTSGGANVTGTVNVAGNTATFRPNNSLAGSTQYTATIDASVTDAAGNALGTDYSWQFTTGATPDTTPPTVTTTSPARNATGINLNTAVSATFSEAMNNATLNTTSFTLEVYRGPSVSGTVQVTGNTAVFTPTSSLLGSTRYRARIHTSATDAAGNALASRYTWYFTTGAAPDTTPPTVSTTSPSNGATGIAQSATVSATFSEAMNNATLNTGSFTVRRAGTGSSISGTVNVTGNTARFSPSANLAANTQYVATVTTTAADAAGNALQSDHIWAFTTAVAAPNGTVNLVWDAVSHPNLVGYRVYYGTSPGNYMQPRGAGISVGNVMAYQITGLSSGTRYYFAVTAVDGTNNESLFSNEVFKDMP